MICDDCGGDIEKSHATDGDCMRFLLIRNNELKAQLRKAQEVINRHVADQIEGLHCVDCVAGDDEACDCPMPTKISEAMKGFETVCEHCKGFGKCPDNCPSGWPNPCCHCS